MIANIKTFCSPQTTEDMQRRVILVLIAAIAALFVSMLAVSYSRTPTAGVVRFTDGDTTLELAADNSVTIRKAPLAR